MLKEIEMMSLLRWGGKKKSRWYILYWYVAQLNAQDSNNGNHDNSDRSELSDNTLFKTLAGKPLLMDVDSELS